MTDLTYSKIIEDIDSAYSISAASSSLKELEAIWRQLENLSARVESQYRLRLSSDSSPKKVSTLSKEYQYHFDHLDHKGYNNPNITSQAINLIQSLLYINEIPSESFSIYQASLSRLEVCFDNITWLICPSAIAWPGINVRTYTPASFDSLELKAITFHNAQDLLDYTQEVFTHGH